MFDNHVIDVFELVDKGKDSWLFNEDLSLRVDVGVEIVAYIGVKVDEMEFDWLVGVLEEEVIRWWLDVVVVGNEGRNDVQLALIVEVVGWEWEGRVVNGIWLLDGLVILGGLANWDLKWVRRWLLFWYWNKEERAIPSCFGLKMRCFCSWKLLEYSWSGSE